MDRLNPRQLTVLATMYYIGSSILVSPAYLAERAGNDAWISGLLGLTIGFLPLLLIYALEKSYPGKHLGQIFESALGKLTGRIIGFAYFLTYPMGIITLSLRDIGDFLTTSLLRDTPLEVLILFTLVVISIAVRLGIGTISRTAELFFPWVILLILLLLVFVSPKADIENIEPVLASGWQPVMAASLSLAGFPFMEHCLFMTIFANVKGKSSLALQLGKGTLISGLLIVLVVFMCLAVLNPGKTATYVFPTYELGKMIEFGQFVRRIEVIVAFIWFFTIFFRVSFVLYSMVTGLSYLLKLHDYRVITFPVAVISGALALLWYPNITELNNFSKMWTYITLLSGLGLPILLLGGSAVQKMFRGPKSP
ncbi:GerAB/ArcD/ProY family transporter [Paenibacillus chitinolyticus]|uniref:GerAB/ArcD/ProY family transporter n=1 Tax=Paenibacillus chitinolyticus TaxID=79263 RepID=UPI0036564043